MTPDRALFLRRKLGTMAMVSLACGATLFGLAVLALILFELLRRGVSAITLDTFIMTTPPPGASGGLLNPIIGSLAMTALAILGATPVGVLAGTWLSEYGRESRLAQAVRFLNDTLLSAPSIIIGLFVYGIAVRPVGHFSGWAGAIALGLIALPVIVRTTEDMLTLIPESLREAGMAVGAPRWRVIVSIAYRAALSGIVTGALLAIARISGETAPLLFTALNNQFLTKGMNSPMASLPVAIFQFAMSPYENWQKLAWAGALMVSVAVLALNIVARIVARRSTQ